MSKQHTYRLPFPTLKCMQDAYDILIKDKDVVFCDTSVTDVIGGYKYALDLVLYKPIAQCLSLPAYIKRMA